MWDAKKYLEKIKRMDTQINIRWEDLQRLYAMRTKMTTVFSSVAVSGSGSQSKLEDITIKILGIEEEINRKIDRFVDFKLEATKLLDQLQNVDHARALHKIYFEYKKIEEVAEELGVSTRTIHNWHNGGIQELNKARKHQVDNGKS